MTRGLHIRGGCSSRRIKHQLCVLDCRSSGRMKYRLSTFELQACISTRTDAWSYHITGLMLKASCGG